MTRTLTNTNGAFSSVAVSAATTFEATQYPSTIGTFVAGAAITAGAAVQAEATLTAAVSLTVVVTDGTGTTEPALFVGIALEGAAAGETVQVVTAGYAIANIDNAEPAFGDVASVDVAVDGVLDTVTVADAADIIYDVVGVFLSEEDIVGTNQAAVWLK